MKKRLQKFGEDLIPLSRKQNFLLLILIACVFQFLLFFTPALAAEAISNQEEEISLGLVNKNYVIDAEAQKIMDKILNQNKEEETLKLEEVLVNDDEENVVIELKEEVITEDVVISTSVHVITAYNSEVGQTDDSPCVTANNFNVCEHGEEDTIAANFLKFGTKVKIPDLYGDRIFIVRDRMNKKHPDRVDIWMKERSSAIKFGIKTARIQVIK